MLGAFEIDRNGQILDWFQDIFDKNSRKWNHEIWSFLLQMTVTSLKWGQNLELCKKTFPTFAGGLKTGV